MNWAIEEWNVLEEPWPVSEGSVQTVVTSPPYWGLRDYGVPGQLGLEATPEEYVERMVRVFRSVRRALRKDGTLWLNMGDCYAGKGTDPHHTKGDFGNGTGTGQGCTSWAHRGQSTPNTRVSGLKRKDLVGMPWRLAFALQRDGWYLRADVVWSKPNPMPESVLDRPTRAHEYVFLLSRRERYFYDADAIRTVALYPDGPNAPDKIASPHGQGYTRRAKAPSGWSAEAGRHDGVPEGRYRSKRRASTPEGKEHGPVWDGARRRHDQGERPDKQRGHGRRHDGFNGRWDAMTKEEQQALGANARTVWEIATQPFSEAHFATFPAELARRCIAAGSRKGDLVLDPFAGAGTAVLVADRLGRRGLGLELNPEYVEMARKRIRADAPLFQEEEPICPEMAEIQLEIL